MRLRHPVLILVLVLLLAGCGGQTASQEPTAQPTPEQLSPLALQSLGVTPEDQSVRCLKFISDVGKMGAKPDQEIEWHWKVSNCGDGEWVRFGLFPIAYDGEPLKLLGATVPQLKPGQEGEVIARLRTPKTAGTSIHRFMVGSRSDQLFRDELWAVVVVSP